MDELPLLLRRGLYYQHDGCPSHTARIVSDFLSHEFEQNWIGYRAPIPWPARSCDLTPLDFFLWGRLKDLIFKRRHIQNRAQLEDATRQAFAAINPVELVNSCTSVQKRCLQRVAAGHSFRTCLKLYIYLLILLNLYKSF